MADQADLLPMVRSGSPIVTTVLDRWLQIALRAWRRAGGFSWRSMAAESLDGYARTVARLIFRELKQ